jgi:hypothetical protein
MSNSYLEVRPGIKSGDLLAWSNRKVESFKDLLLQVVRIFTKSEYTHVGVAWVVDERVFVIEAVMPVVRIYPLSSLTPFYLIPLKLEWKKETENFALEQIGLDYSIMQAVESLYECPNVDDNWQCAELAHAIILKDGVDLGNNYTPADLVRNALRISDGLRFVE